MKRFFLGALTLIMISSLATGQASLLNQDILQVQKELSVILRKVNDERTFLSYLCYFLVLTNH